MTSTHTAFLPAEWYPQSAVQLTWPHDKTDWASMLHEVTACYVRIATEIALRERLLVVTPNPLEVNQLLHEHLPQKAFENVSIHEIPTNDTWARDHSFITILSPEGPRLLDFRFNGWGMKFPAWLDNQICRNLMKQHVLRGEYEGHLDFVLEGGSIESDGEGTILTTQQCLLAPNRNEPLNRDEIEQRLKLYLHADRILWLHHGYLAGDDTDSHIDTLVRLCPNNTIAYVKCTDMQDEHFAELRLMEEELQSLRTREGLPYYLVPLPMAAPAFDDEGQRLPATYANFLVINGAVLLPTYQDSKLDQMATQQLQKAFPGYEIIGIDCRPLIRQHGSLHCSTMQFPEGVL